MKKHLNTLFVTLEGCWLSKDGDTVKVNAEGTCLLRVPLHNLEGIVTLGWDIGVSPYLMGACAERGITLSFCNPYGKFLAGVQGFMKGNILLRREQYRWADDEARWVGVAREMIGAKIANCRSLLLRAQRTYGKDLSEAIVWRLFAAWPVDAIPETCCGALKVPQRKPIFPACPIARGRKIRSWCLKAAIDVLPKIVLMLFYLFYTVCCAMTPGPPLKVPALMPPQAFCTVTARGVPEWLWT